ncbi:MAG: hypothetical protein ABGZ35_01005, partial [Planctomycetaceae bacterium]
GVAIMLWDAQTGERLLTLTGHTDTVEGVSFGNDSNQIISVSRIDIKCWDAATGLETSTRIFAGHTGPMDIVSFSPDRKRIVCSSYDMTARLWDLETGEELLVLHGYNSDFTSVSFSADGTKIVSGSGDKTVRLWDAKTGAELLILRGHTDEVTSARFSPDGNRVVSGGRDQTVRLWDAATGNETLMLEVSPSFVQSASFSPDGTRIVGSGGDVRLWDSRSWTAERRAARQIAESHRQVGLKIAEFTSGPTAEEQWYIGDMLQKERNKQGALDAYLAALRKPIGYIRPVRIARIIWLIRYIEENATEIQIDDAETQSLISSLPEYVDPTDPVIRANFYQTDIEIMVGQLRALDFINVDFEASEFGVSGADFSPKWIAKRDSMFISNFADVEHFDALNRSQLKRGWALVKKQTYTQYGVRNIAALWHRTDDTANDYKNAERLNEDIWRRVLSPFGSISELEMVEFATACKRFPRGMFLNTLGVAHYRSGKYQAAIKACTESLIELPNEQNLPGPHPIDLAVLAMSHFQLGNQVQANSFRERLNEAMTLNVFIKDKEAQQFLEESG